MKIFLALLFSCLCTQAQGLRSPAIVANLAPSGPASPVPDIVWWKFDENTGTNVFDSSTQGTNNLTLFNSAMWVAGKVGTGIAGNGSSYYAYSSNALVCPNIITVCYWIKDSAYGSFEWHAELGSDVIAQGNDWLVHNNTVIGGYVSADAGSYRQESATPPSVDVWHHLAWILDNSTSTGNVTLFIDGVEQSLTLNNDNKTGTGYTPRTLWLLSRTGTAVFSNASLDDFRIYTGDKTADIQAIYADPR